MNTRATTGSSAEAATSSSTLTGEVHRFVGITADGTWVATDATSHDSGATWQATKVDNDHSLASSRQSVAFDEDGYAYVAGGAPYVQLWKSTEPLDVP